MFDNREYPMYDDHEYPDSGGALLAIVGFVLYGFVIGAVFMGTLWTLWGWLG
jgi:hypothetical protein